MALRLFAALLLLCAYTIAVCSAGDGDATEEGDLCRTSNGIAGVCTDIDNCRWATDLVLAGLTPRVCSFKQGTHPIICCANSQRKGYLTEASRNSTSYRKCVEYSTKLDVEEWVPVLVPFTVLSNQSECSIQADGTQLIIGGKAAVPNEFPHMAVLGYGPNERSVSWRCGGSLISESFILTAGHCLYDRELGEVKWVRLGDLNVSSSADDRYAQQIGIMRRIKHPDYKASAYYNDIALLQLEDDVEITDAVKPACIHHVEGYTSPELVAIVSGWGKTSNWGGTSDILMKADLKFVDAARCNQSYTSLTGSKKLVRGIDDNLQICAGDPKGEKDTCQGDSGGPIQLVLSEPTCSYAVVGVTSFGPANCAAGTTPAVYTKIETYIPWIESVVWPND